MLPRRIRMHVALQRLVLMSACYSAFVIVVSSDPICIPSDPPPPRVEYVFDPTEVSTDVILTPVCTELREPRVQATVEPPLRPIFNQQNSSNERFSFGYVCEGSVSVAQNFSRNLPRGGSRQEWTSELIGDSNPQALALGDVCHIFGCFAYEIDWRDGQRYRKIYIKNVSNTSCVIDKDECEDGTAQCDHNCVNVMNGTANSYYCTCRKGFVLSEDQHTCIDVDECTTGLHTCDQICTVTSDGWYNCSCEDGFTMSHNDTCDNINECLLNGTVLCDTERTGRHCNDTSGSYQCTVCLEGYELTEDKQMCVDINECGVGGTAQCQQQCNNTEGSYNCSCNKWYLQDGLYNCTEIDVCSELKVNCSGHSKCRNAPDSEEGYECVCDSGYERRGNTCSLIGIIHVYWVVPVLALMIILLLGCIFKLRKKYVKNINDPRRRYNILFRYQLKKEKIDPAHNPVDFYPMRKISYSFSLMSALETCEYPMYPTGREKDNEQEAEVLCTSTQLYSSNIEEIKAQDKEHNRRELSTITEGSDDDRCLTQDAVDFFGHLDNKESTTKQWDSSNSSEYITDATKEGILQQNIVDGSPQTDGRCVHELHSSHDYVQEVPLKYASDEYMTAPFSKTEASCIGYVAEISLNNAGRLGCQEISSDFTQHEQVVLDQVSPEPRILQEDSAEMEQSPLCEPKLNTFTPTDTATNDSGYNINNSGYGLDAGVDESVAQSNHKIKSSDFNTASSGYVSEPVAASYILHLQSTSSYVTDATVTPNSSEYIPSEFSTVSSGYGSETGVSVHKHGSVTSKLSCGTPRMPHFSSEWANSDYAPPTTIQSGSTTVQSGSTTVQSGSRPSTAPSQEVSDKESLRPVAPLSLGKGTKCDDVSLNSPICVVTPDGYVDSVFDDTPLTKCPPNLQEDLKSKHPTSGTNHSKGGHYVTPVTSGDYIPYPSHNEASSADLPSQLSETCYRQEDEPNNSYTNKTDSQSHTSHKNDITFVIPV